jgi:hypothetical protein
MRLSFEARDLFFGLIGSSLLRSRRIRSRLFDAGEVASFQDFVDLHYKDRAFFLSRNLLRREFLSLLNQGECSVFEFGVAQGNTALWLSKNVSNPLFAYFGYDTFTGLPDDWFRDGLRYRPKGFFDNGGKFPELDDSRFAFRKGLIQDNSGVLLDDLMQPGFKVFLFDFDLYEPTKFAWKYVKESANSGDYLYFDEAFDSDNERRVIIEEILPYKDDFEYIGNTTISLLLRKR